MISSETTGLLVELMNSFRGKVKPKAFIEMTALILALLRVNPSAVRQLAAQTENLDRKDAETGAFILKELHGNAGTESLVAFYLDNTQLQSIHGIIYHMLARQLCRHSRHIRALADATEELYISRISRNARQEHRQYEQIRGLTTRSFDASGGDLLDSHCGLGKIVRIAETDSITAYIGDPELAFIGHHLSIARGHPIPYWHHDYLHSVCTPSESELTLDGYARPESYDCIYAEPPYRRMLTDKERAYFLNHFPLLTQPSDMLPSNACDALWVQATLRQLKRNGVAFMTVPNGWLGRGGYDGKVRRYLIEHGHLLSVISLRNAKSGQSNVSVIVLKADANSTDRILIMERSTATELQHDGHILADLNGEYISKAEIAKHYPVTMLRNKELLSAPNGYPNLQPYRYLQQGTATKAQPSAAEEFDKLADARVLAESAQLQLHQLIEKYLD